MVSVRALGGIFHLSGVDSISRVYSAETIQKS